MTSPGQPQLGAQDLTTDVVPVREGESWLWFLTCPGHAWGQSQALLGWGTEVEQRVPGTVNATLSIPRSTSAALNMESERCCAKASPVLAMHSRVSP